MLSCLLVVVEDRMGVMLLVINGEITNEEVGVAVTNDRIILVALEETLTVAQLFLKIPLV